MKRVKILSNELIIRNFKLSDISNNYIRWLNDDELLKFSRNRFIKYNKKKSENYYNTFKKTDNLFLAILDRNYNLIGTLTCYFYFNKKICDIGMLLGDKKYMSKGFAKKAWILLIKFLKKNYKIKKISAGTIKSNIKMIKIFKKSGMIYDGYRKKNFFNEKFYDEVFYAKYL